MPEPTHWENGAIFFGYYSLGHNMTLRETRVKALVTVGGIRQERIIVKPVHCRRCGHHSGSAALMRVCAKSPTPVPPDLTTRGLDADIYGEKRGSETVQRLALDSVTFGWVEAAAVGVKSTLPVHGCATEAQARATGWAG